eukprot:7730835-Alexandrium_andersonii.AAC.1
MHPVIIWPLLRWFSWPPSGRKLDGAKDDRLNARDELPQLSRAPSDISNQESEHKRVHPLSTLGGRIRPLVTVKVGTGHVSSSLGVFIGVAFQP